MFPISRLLCVKPKFHFIFISCLLTIFHLSPLTLACSSRSLPKPRPINAPTTTRAPTTTVRTTTTSTTTTTTPRPNITFPTFKCPENYDAWYCLNEATCFTVKIGESIMYNCECAVGFMGPRCEYKELDGSYQPKRPRPILERASIASGVTCIFLLLLFFCLIYYIHSDHQSQNIYEELDYTFSSSKNHCSFCSDKNCAPAMNFLLVSSDKDGNASWLRQHIEAFPMGFTTKRFNKL